jgi:hypothetical protein
LSETFNQTEEFNALPALHAIRRTAGGLLRHWCQRPAAGCNENSAAVKPMRHHRPFLQHWLVYTLKGGE